MSTNTLSGQVTGENALRLLPIMKRVEVISQGSLGQELRLKLPKKEAAIFLKENPDTSGEVCGETLILQP